jgi:hypothetical protein
MAKTLNFSELVVQAERAVQGVKDPDLRRIAFEKVLQELLGGRSPSDVRATNKVGSSRSTRKDTSSGPTGYVREMAGEGFFKKQKTISDVQGELANRGHHIPTTSLSGPLQNLCKEKVLRRQRKDGQFVYSNW